MSTDPRYPQVANNDPRVVNNDPNYLNKYPPQNPSETIDPKYTQGTDVNANQTIPAGANQYPVVNPLTNPTASPFNPALQPVSPSHPATADDLRHRMAVTAAIRQGFTDIGITPNGNEVKVMVDHQIAVHNRLVNGDFNEGRQVDSSYPVQHPAGAAYPDNPVNPTVPLYSSRPGVEPGLIVATAIPVQ